jgi:hypothetical protein
MAHRSTHRWISTVRSGARCGAAIVVAAVAFIAWSSPADAQTNDWDLIAPHVECVTVNGDGTYTALFGTSNYTRFGLRVSNGSFNQVTPSNLDVDPPTWIPVGREVGVFTVTQNVGQPINYKLGFTSVQATSTGVPCNTAPQVAEAPYVVGLLGVAGAGAVIGYRRLGISSSAA